MTSAWKYTPLMDRKTLRNARVCITYSCHSIDNREQFSTREGGTRSPEGSTLKSDTRHKASSMSRKASMNVGYLRIVTLEDEERETFQWHPPLASLTVRAGMTAEVERDRSLSTAEETSRPLLCRTIWGPTCRPNLNVRGSTHDVRRSHTH